MQKIKIEIVSAMVKTILICFGTTLISTVVFGKSYHVAMNGNDTNNGSLTAPYKTIQSAANFMLPGDTCYIHAGTYYETVRPINSGVEGCPLVFTAYQNDEALVHGGRVITGWTKYKGNIYQAPVSSEVKDLFVDRQYMLWARHPNMPYDPVKGFDMCRPTLGTANPPASVDWTGVIAVQRNKEGWWNNYTKPNSYVLLGDNVSLGGWLMGVPGLIDSEGEWCWKNGVLYLWAPGGKDPNSLLVEAKVRDSAFDLTGRNYVVLKKITVFGATVNMNGSTHCMLDGCKVFYVSSSSIDISTFFIKSWDNCSPMTTNLPGKGILVGGSYNTIQNCEIAYSWGNCVSLLGSNNKVYNSHIYNGNWGGHPSCGILAMNGGGHIVRKNTLHDTQSCLLVCTNKFDYNPQPLDPWYIDYNELYNAGLAGDDCGVVYCFMTNGNGSVISYNWIHDNYNGYSTTLHSGSGIYLDNYSSNFIVRHNVVWNMMYGATATGIRANNPTSGYLPNYHQIYNNTMYNCRKAINSPDNDWNGTLGWPYWDGTKIFNNILLQPLTFGPATIGNNYYGTSPMFTDEATHDFHLKSGSACINSGAVIPGITDGYIGSAPDIGAYEYGGTDWVPGYKATGSIPTSIPQGKIAPGIRVYPNPASGELFIESGQTNDKSYVLKLFSAKGELLKTEYLDAGAKQHRLDLRSFKSGIYILQLGAGSLSYTEKIIITE